ncbi:MAG: hypothetical protein JSV49_00075 [Thermoplasmata archaeon]|nr:MAG: hypothetical protein JSV49_00075 [Thermoplasmata archaeon]
MSDIVCEYRLESAGSKLELVLDCRTCKRTQKKSDDRCIDKIIRTMENEYNINSILMTNYALTQFQGDALELLHQFVGLRTDLKTMQERKVKPDLSKHCEGCELKPSDLFAKLRELLYPDFDRFTAQLSECVKYLNASLKELDRESRGGKKNPKLCLSCIGDTYKDLTYLFIHYRDLAKQVAIKGFLVVVE